MFDISFEEIKQLETFILPPGCNFSEEQVTVIRTNHSFDVVACPGSGKTTVLIAKIALLINKMSETEQGICVITHTNTGVEEILKELRKVGIYNLAHPHFIGTIHDFFNTFFAMRAYNLFFGNQRSVNILEDDDYQNIFSKYFNNFKPPWWNRGIPSSKRFGISFHDEGNLNLTGLEGKSYGDSILQTFKVMLQSGILRHNDTLELSEWYIRNYLDQLQKAFSSRFKFLFIDETQDTSIKQYDLIQSVFTSRPEGHGDIVIQRYGDPYQALYNLFNGEDDAWVPVEENSIQIATSNRFGTSIAEILKTTCIQNYHLLTGNPDISSFPPHLFIFKDSNQQQLLTVYAKIIKNLERTNDGFKNMKKKIYAISRNHDELTKYSTEYIKKTNDKNVDSLVKQSLDLLLKIVLRILRHYEINNSEKGFFTLETLKEHLQYIHEEEYRKTRKLFSKWIKNFFVSSEDKYDVIVQEIKQSFEQLVKTVWNINMDVEISDAMFTSVKVKIKDILLKQIPLAENQINKFSYEGVTINLNSIHAVKGETHRATLLIESTSYMDLQFKDEYGSDLYSIFSFLMGEYDAERAKEKNVNMYLKLAYVGLSRPTHFAGVAINEKNISNLADKLTYATELGWNVINIGDFL